MALNPLNRARTAYALLAISWLSAASCSEEKPEEASLSPVGLSVLEAWGDFAVSGYGEFAELALQLETEGNALCDGGTTGSLEAARSAYVNARIPWMRNRVFGFGPEVELPERWGPKIDFQPPRHDDLADYLASEDELKTPSKTGAHLRGFPALEYLLFSEQSETLQAGSRSCELLMLLGRDFAESSAELAKMWSPDQGNYVAQLGIDGGASLAFEGPHEALSGLVNRMGYVVENIRDQRLRDVVLDGEVQTELVVSRLSSRALGDIKDSLDALDALYWGEEQRPGLSAYALDEGQDFDEQYREAMSLCRERLSELQPSLLDALESKPEQVSAFDETLAELQALYQVEFIGRLELSQIFNDVDGD